MLKENSIISFFKSGNFFVFLIGAVLAIWLNEIVSPQLIIVFGLPNLYSVNAILWFIISIIVIIFWAFITKKLYKNLKTTWFFVGASFASLVYAGINLYEISWLYYINVGKFLPNISVEGYSFPAIYMFKLFRSIFLTTAFGIIGYWDLLRKKENKSETVTNKPTENVVKTSKFYMDKEAELLKIQVDADAVHTRHSASLSFVLTFVVTGLFVSFTLYFEKIFPFVFTIGFMLAIAVLASIIMKNSNKEYNEKIEKIRKDIDDRVNEIETINERNHVLKLLNDPSIGEDR